MSRSEANHLQDGFLLLKIQLKIQANLARDPCIYTIGNNSRIGFPCSAQCWRGFEGVLVCGCFDCVCGAFWLPCEQQVGEVPRQCANTPGVTT